MKSTRSSKNLIQPSQFVFYDKNIEEVETILISARVDNFTFIAVDKNQELFELINFHLEGISNIDVSIVAHGNENGIFLGKEFVNEKYIDENLNNIKNLKINNLSFFLVKQV